MRRTSTVALLVLGALQAPGCTSPDPGALFDQGRYEEAEREYRQALARDPGSAEVHYDLGATAIRLREHEAARPHLEIASRTGDRRLRQWAFYNIGNTRLEPVVLDLSEEPRDDLVAAIVAYKRALLLDPDDEDARWNLELARRLLEREMESPRPRPDPRTGGGGGSGGGGPDDADSGSADPRDRPASAGGRAPELSRTEAERVLMAAEQRELGLQREKLRRPQPPVVSH